MSVHGPTRSYPHVRFDSGFRRESGLDVLTLSSSLRDPKRSLPAAKHRSAAKAVAFVPQAGKMRKVVQVSCRRRHTLPCVRHRSGRATKSGACSRHHAYIWSKRSPMTDRATPAAARISRSPRSILFTACHSAIIAPASAQPSRLRISVGLVKTTVGTVKKTCGPRGILRFESNLT
jgi:hypothetical protein